MLVTNLGSDNCRYGTQKMTLKVIKFQPPKETFENLVASEWDEEQMLEAIDKLHLASWIAGTLIACKVQEDGPLRNALIEASWNLRKAAEIYGYDYYAQPD